MIRFEYITRLLSVCIIMLVCVPQAISQTPSADCSTAATQQAVVGNACNPVTFNVNNVLGNPAAPTCAGFVSTGEDGWCWFTATATTTTITYSNSNLTDAVIFVYTGTCGSLTFQNCADAVWGNFPSTESLTLATVIGQTYFIRICRFSGTAGAMNGTLCVYSAPPIANDLCDNAIPISCGTTVVGTTTGAGVDAATAGCGSSTSPAIWYTFMGDGSVVTLDLCASSFDTQISVYTGTCVALTCYAYNDDSFNCPGLQSWVQFNTIVGTLYYIQVHGWGSASGAFSMDVDCVMPAANDPCSGAIPIVCGETISGNTTGMTTDAIPAGCGVSVSGGAWYSIVGNGDVITASLCGATTFDTQLSVFTGSCAALTCVDAVDDFCGLQSEVSWISTAGVTYYILVHGYFEDGPFNLAMTCTPYVPGPQDCVGSITICTDTQFGGNSAGSGIISDLDATNQGCLASGENQTSWYVFSPTTTGTISFTINPTPIVDYDFAIWGPMVTPSCPMVGDPFRCSFSALWAPTGLGNGATDPSENAAGDAWVEPITVGAAEVGQYYFMCLDNFSASTTPFVFDWSLSGVILDCSIMLPVVWTSFSGEQQGLHNVLQWTTATEMNNSHFEVMRSDDGIHFNKIGEVAGHGISLTEHQYNFADRSPEMLTTYYMLRQVDYNGQSENSSIIAVHREAVVLVAPNPMQQELNLTLNTSVGQLVCVKLSDATGRVVLHECTAGQTTAYLSWNTEWLCNGLYTLSVTNTAGAMLMQQKVMKE